MRQFDTFQRAFANNWGASSISCHLQNDLEYLSRKYSHCVFKYIAMSEELYNKAGGPSMICSIGNKMTDVKIAFHLHGLEYCIFFEYDDGAIPAVNANPEKIWLSTVSESDNNWFSKALREKNDSAVDPLYDAWTKRWFFEREERTENMFINYHLEIEKVIFNEPATIVLWNDGTKTVVKTHGKEKFDPEKGLAMAVSKKVLGTNESRSNYYDVFQKWIPEKPKKENKKVPDPRKGGTK